MKRFIASIIAAISLPALAVLPSTISWEGNIPGQPSFSTFLNNPTFYSVTSLGAITPTGGIAPTGNPSLIVSNIPIGPVALGSIGTNTTDVAGQLWITDIYVPTTRSVTGVGVLQGGTATTDSITVAIYSPTGTYIAASATANTLSGANTFKQIALPAVQTLAGPATYQVVVQGNGTAGGAIQTVPAPYMVRSATAAGTYGALPTSITVPSSFTAGQAPVIYLY